MKKMLFVAATALFMVGGAFAQSATNSSKDEASVAVAQEEMTAAVVEKQCDEQEVKYSRCEDKQATASADAKKCDKGAKKACCKDKKHAAVKSSKRECSKDDKEDCCKKKAATADTKKCNSKKKDCCKKKAETKS